MNPIESEEFKELLLIYKKTYLHIKGFISVCEAWAIDRQDYKEIESCEAQLKELDEKYQQTLQKFTRS